MNHLPTAQGARRTRPLVWVKRLVLYGSIDPVHEVRAITFTTGLNVIQGSSDESDEGFESGHGIGKTTVCRLIRYCLGEKSFGQKHVIEEIKHCFPAGHVGAVIEVGGTEWAVLRRLGHRGKECALEDVGLDGLIESDAPKPYHAFTECLAATVLSGIPVKDTLSGGQVLQWLHVLAMCSRDQESRYDRFWNWRDPRSESGVPKFTKPKVDAGLCVRAVIGLLDPAEPRLRAKLEELEASLERKRGEIKERQAEPQFHITRLRTSLATACGVPNAQDAPLDEGSLLGLEAVTRTRLGAIQEDVARIDNELVPLDRRISLTAASLLEPGELAEQQQAAREVTGEGNDALLADIERLRSSREAAREVESSLCRYGGVLIGQCHHVQARTEQFDRDLLERQRSTLPTVSEREQAAARLAEQAQRQQSVVGQIRQRLDALNRQKNDLVERRRNLNEQIGRIPPMLAEIREWDSILNGSKPNTDIQRLERETADATREIDATNLNLAQLIAAQAGRAKLFEDRFNEVVRRTLTVDYKGVVKIEEEGVGFRIKHGESLSGEAYETLAILLADLALLFGSNVDHSRHPGLLLHDSPREADLNLRIYERLLDAADARMRESGQQGDVPYQYIVTTTTLPSQRLRNTTATILTLSGGAGSLFGRQLELPPPTQSAPTLFDEEEA